jgi:hypothetical protein
LIPAERTLADSPADSLTVSRAEAKVANKTAKLSEMRTTTFIACRSPIVGEKLLACYLKDAEYS